MIRNIIRTIIINLAIGCNIIPVSFHQAVQTGNESLLTEDNKVQLRQYGVKKASSEANIETTNVDYDLRYLYGGEENYSSYNIWDLVPNENDSKDLSFKFLCAKPVGKNLYLYLYIYEENNLEISNGKFKISLSKNQNSETGLFNEVYKVYDARFVNSYGYKQRFVKFAIDNIVTTDEMRFYISNCFITFEEKESNKKSYSKIYSIKDEFVFKNGENSDFIYEYFKDDYIRIVDKEVALLLTNNKESYDGLISTSAYEDTYCFFNTDVKIDELKEIGVSYQKLTYEVDHSAAWNTMANTPGSGGRPTIKNTDIFRGLYNQHSTDKGLGGDYRKVYKYTEKDLSSFGEKTITAGSESSEVTRPYFLWWTQQLKYTIPTIQNCLDTSNLNNDETKGIKTFIEEVQEKRVSENKDKYQWCFKVDTSLREVIDVKKIGGFLGFGGEYHAYTSCHEIMQTLILWLNYRTNNQDFTFNTLDIPVDTTSVHLQYVPFETLGDIILENITSGWDFIKTNFRPFLIAISAILIIIICFPIIKLIIRMISSLVKFISKKVKNHRVKRKNE